MNDQELAKASAPERCCCSLARATKWGVGTRSCLLLPGTLSGVQPCEVNPVGDMLLTCDCFQP